MTQVRECTKRLRNVLQQLKACNQEAYIVQNGAYPGQCDIIVESKDISFTSNGKKTLTHEVCFCIAPPKQKK
jgi:G:T-mismatch repair DNA endonuclease (very short patch repair protein)